MPIQWRPEMAIDNAVIDHDHQALIAIVNEFCTAEPGPDEFSRMQEILTKLDHYTRIHFAREEKLQVAARYPFRDAHHQEHQVLIHRLAQIRGLLVSSVLPTKESEGESPETNARAPLTEARAKIDRLLHDWLVEHVVKSDLRMKPFVKAMAHHVDDLEPLLSVNHCGQETTLLNA